MGERVGEGVRKGESERNTETAIVAARIPNQTHSQKC